VLRVGRMSNINGLVVAVLKQHDAWLYVAYPRYCPIGNSENTIRIATLTDTV
jgi:hypothetical protein